MKKIGITTTVPSEILLAAGYKIIDLNNIFITAKDHRIYIDKAEKDGFPKNLCSWIKGIYGVCILHDIKEIVGVIQGDCSNTKILVEILQESGVKVYPFGFPHSQSLEELEKNIDDFRKLFGVSKKKVIDTRNKVLEVRKLGKKIDELTYESYKVTGFENHLNLVSFSDFNGDLEEFKIQLKEFIKKAKKRKPFEKKLKLGYIGVPPMTADLYDFVLEHNSMIVYNEVQREFAFLRANNSKDLSEQYYDFTYVYGHNYRLQELKKEINKRNLDGIIHYTQAFCYRSMENILLKKNLDIPILSIEGDKDRKLDARSKLRIEAFLDMLLDKKEGVFL